VLHVVASSVAHATAVITTASGPSPSDIQSAVNNFRTSIALGGGNNGVGGGVFTNGFRNINWDAVPDSFAEPNTLFGNFFNANSPRGLLMHTPGVEFLVSADSDNPTGNLPEFGSIESTYPGIFQTFSPERLFVAFGSTITDNFFFVPSSPETMASVFGFGVVFTDVDIFGSTSLEFFDVTNRSLGVFNVPVQNNGLSFLGVSFDAGERVKAVRIIAGNTPIDAGVIDGGSIDVVAMDDFMYSEPQAVVPEPGTAALILLGFGGMAALRRHMPAAVCT
jgi:PEP-CTERM motif